MGSLFSGVPLYNANSYYSKPNLLLFLSTVICNLFLWIFFCSQFFRHVHNECKTLICFVNINRDAFFTFCLLFLASKNCRFEKKNKLPAFHVDPHFLGQREFWWTIFALVWRLPAWFRRTAGVCLSLFCIEFRQNRHNSCGKFSFIKFVDSKL